MQPVVSRWLAFFLPFMTCSYEQLTCFGMTQKCNNTLRCVLVIRIQMCCVYMYKAPHLPPVAMNAACQSLLTYGRQAADNVASCPAPGKHATEL
jgi:hypothetical protein